MATRISTDPREEPHLKKRKEDTVVDPDVLGRLAHFLVVGDVRPVEMGLAAALADLLLCLVARFLQVRSH